MDKLRIKPAISFIEKNIIFFETFLWSFYGQSFFKTVRGPFLYNVVSYSLIFGPVINEGVFVYLNCRNIRLLYVFDQNFNVAYYTRKIISFDCYKFVGDRFVCSCEDSMTNVVYTCILVNIIVRLDFCTRLASDNSSLNFA